MFCWIWGRILSNNRGFMIWTGSFETPSRDLIRTLKFFELSRIMSHPEKGIFYLLGDLFRNCSYIPEVAWPLRELDVLDWIGVVTAFLEFYVLRKYSHSSYWKALSQKTAGIWWLLLTEAMQYIAWESIENVRERNITIESSHSTTREVQVGHKPSISWYCYLRIH